MGDAAPDPPAADEELPPPTGTVFLLTIMLALLAGMWGAVYLLLVRR